MKNILALSSTVLIMLVLSAGCQQQNAFPEVMVGIWQAEVNRWGDWGIKFEPDGSIRKIIHPVAGPVRLGEGGVYLEGKQPDSHAIFVMGPVEAKYHPRTEQLQVTVILDHFEMKLPGGELKGKIESYFTGPISKDGQTWNAELVEFGWLEGASDPDIEAIKANPAKMVFTKVDVNSLAEQQSQ